MRPRSELVDLDSTRWYHCTQRCVRRAFLCGRDPYTGKSYEHRRGWLEARIKLVSSVFSIDLGSKAVQANHFHLVIRIDRDRATTWSDEEVMRRWFTLYPGTKSELKVNPKSKKDRDSNAKLIAEWRHRLWDISWYMKAISEPIARRANKEDGCTGRFWEGRFKSQPLLDDGALIGCMAYVDLNPIRAGEAKSLEECDFTSVKARLSAYRKEKRRAALDGRRVMVAKATPEHLIPMPLRCATDVERGVKDTEDGFLPISLESYVELLQWTAEMTGDNVSVMRRPKRGLAMKLRSLGLNPNHFAQSVISFHQLTLQVVGSPENIRAEAKRRGMRHLMGARKLADFYCAA